VINRLSALWGKLRPKYVKLNPWDLVERPPVTKKKPVVPTEQDVTDFYQWLEKRYPGWELPKLFAEVKALTSRRLQDLCQVQSWQLDVKAKTLTITPEQDKTNTERVFPLPEDIVEALDKMNGKTHLWERYSQDAKTYCKGARIKKEEFTTTIFTMRLRGSSGSSGRQAGSSKVMV
jgi:integrase